MRHPASSDVVMIVLERETHRFHLRMTIIQMGEDLCVSLLGGDAPHIGAVALAVPHPGLRTVGKIDASVSVLCVTGHKEDELARRFAHTLATHADCVVSVSCGIHLDNATQAEIGAVLNAADALLDEAVSALS